MFQKMIQKAERFFNPVAYSTVKALTAMNKSIEKLEGNVVYTRTKMHDVEDRLNRVVQLEEQRNRIIKSQQRIVLKTVAKLSELGYRVEVDKNEIVRIRAK